MRSSHNNKKPDAERTKSSGNGTQKVLMILPSVFFYPESEDVTQFAVE